MVLALAVATSIDALAVGVSFAFLGIKQFSAILSPIGIIGFVSFALSMVGLMFGIRFGCGIARRLRAELWGGVILVIIGTKILIEHLFLLIKKVKNSDIGYGKRKVQRNFFMDCPTSTGVPYGYLPATIKSLLIRRTTD